MVGTPYVVYLCDIVAHVDTYTQTHTHKHLCDIVAHVLVCGVCTSTFVCVCNVLRLCNLAALPAHPHTTRQRRVCCGS